MVVDASSPSSVRAVGATEVTPDPFTVPPLLAAPPAREITEREEDDNDDDDPQGRYSPASGSNGAGICSRSLPPSSRSGSP